MPHHDKLIILGDFKTRVDRNHSAWENVIGKHGLGIEDSNGTLLLTTCEQNELVITNTLFQQADKYKTSWMHARSKCWHLLCYVIVRKRDASDFKKTSAKRATTTWSDQRLFPLSKNAATSD